MSTRGRKPKGRKNAAEARGNPSKRGEDEKPVATPATVTIPELPAEIAENKGGHQFYKDAAEFYRRITPEIETLGLVGEIDFAVLTTAANLWATIRWAERDIVAGGHAQVNEKGLETVRPAVPVLQRSASTLGKMLDQIGATPTARARLRIALAGGGDGQGGGIPPEQAEFLRGRGLRLV